LGQPTIHILITERNKLTMKKKKNIKPRRKFENYFGNPLNNGNFAAA